MKKLLLTQRSDRPHWVGDGFPVRSIFSYNDLAQQISPFLLMDYAGPTEFPPSNHRRGVGEHPHRGFETVTIVYEGEVEHRDSAGGGGLIRPGDVQWMTAASGLVHTETHGEEFSKKGGKFEMIQLWVNLPKKDKMNSPRYQGISNQQIPSVSVDHGQLRVIAGEFKGHAGPALTHTPMNLWDMKLQPGSSNVFSVPAGHTAALFVLSGKIQLAGGEVLESAELGLLEADGVEFSVEAMEESKVLFLGGQPLNEPIVGFGPFVMNSPAEIKQAMVDFEEGRMGRISR